MEKLTIAGRTVGPGEAPFVIAEIGSNHNGDMTLARELIDAASQSGADAVKFQSWSSASLISRAEYARNTQYADKKRHFGTLHEMVTRYQLTPEQHRGLADYCGGRNIPFLSSCFSPTEVDLLDELAVPVFKIASMDLNHLPLLAHVARKGKPVILSTGMGELSEIDRALAVLRSGGAGPIALLHCVSLYPPPTESINLRNIPTLQRVFGVPVGFSDHTLGTWAALASVAMGACILEKHFTLDKEMAGWDHWISADPAELSTLVREARAVLQALGSEARTLTEAERAKRLSFRRRVVLKRALPKGHRLSDCDLDFKRPGNGIAPDQAAWVVGRSLARDLDEDAELEWTDLV